MLVRSKKWYGIKAWGVWIAAKRGHKRALVAVARKLAVVMHRMWIDGSVFRSAEDGSATEPSLSNPTALAAAMLALWRAPSDRQCDDRRLAEFPPVGGEAFGGSKRMRRVRYLAGDDSSIETSSALPWLCCPAILRTTCA
ncbi:MAG: hypothetical protein E6614_29895, partial [Bradyrhizobium sp.]|nr:hypothetical protein [Bradyrhizobium sp.]